MGRCKERIPIVLDNINWKDFITYLGFNDSDFDFYVNRCQEYILDIGEYWTKNPDLRLTQVLISLGLLPNKPGFWFYTEEIDYLIENHVVKPEDILFWGTYGKDGKQPLKYITINNMNSEHIEACLKTQKNMNLFYRKVMSKVLRIRKLRSLDKNNR